MNLNKLLNCLNTMEDAYQGERDRRAHILAYTEAYEMIMEELSHPVVYTRCVICGDRDYLNGTHEIKLLMDLNRRIRARLKMRTWSYQAE